jgi:cytochrome c oxidase cbb3-type subunit 3
MKKSWIVLLLFLGACHRRPAAQTQAAEQVAPPSYEQRVGADLYNHYCQACHGDKGAGDGFNSYNLDPHPQDLSDPGFQKKKTDADLADAIRRGGGGVGLSMLMPPYGHTLTSQQIDEVILYLRTFKK